MPKLTHIDEHGTANMVDVGDKAESQRIAIATGSISMKPATLQLIEEGGIKKGDVFSVARIAGIMGAKRTSDLIPLCHPLPITSAKITLDPNAEKSAVHITATVKVTGKTGVEMEALTAVSVTALTIYDMAKAVDKDMVISDIKLVEKQGGKSGLYKRAQDMTAQGGDEKNDTSSAPKSAALRAKGSSLRAQEIPLTTTPTPSPQSNSGTSSHEREAFRRFVRQNNLKIMSWAKEAGVPSGEVFAYLNGKAGRLPTTTLEKLARTLNLKTEDLFSK